MQKFVIEKRFQGSSGARRETILTHYIFWLYIFSYTMAFSDEMPQGMHFLVECSLPWIAMGRWDGPI